METNGHNENPPSTSTGVGRETVQAWDDFCTMVEALDVAVRIGGHRMKAPSPEAAGQLTALTACAQFAMGRMTIDENRRHHDAMEELLGLQIKANAEATSLLVQAIVGGRGPSAGEVHLDRATGCTEEVMEMLGATEHALSVANDLANQRLALLVEATGLLRSFAEGESNSTLNSRVNKFLASRVRVELPYDPSDLPPPSP